MKQNRGFGNEAAVAIVMHPKKWYTEPKEARGMKRIMAIVLCAAMLFALALPAGAEAEDALRTVRERIGDTSEYAQFESSSRTADGRTTYDFSWTRSEPYGSLNVEITDSGVITNYNRYEYSEREDDTPTLAHPDTDAMQKAAEAFLKRINPTVCEKLTVTPEQGRDLYSTSYYFTVQRTENGYPVAEDTGSLTIGADGKTVTYFYLSWTEGVSFESAEKVVSAADAQKAFAAAFGMRLAYERDWSGEEQTVRLIYRPVTEDGTYISAVTGEKLTLQYPDYGARTYGGKNAATEEAATADSGFTGFTEIEQSELDALGELLTAEAEETLLRKNPYLTLAGMELTHRTRQKAWDGDWYRDTLSFSTKGASAYVSLDAKTGAVQNYSYYSSAERPKTNAVSAETAAAKAKEAAKALSGELFGEYREETCADGAVRYLRYVNDVPFDDDVIYAAFDPALGKLTQYSISHRDLAFPSPEGVVSADAAMDAVFASCVYAPEYRFTCQNEAKQYDRAVLVYVLENAYSIRVDAESGELLKNEWEEPELPEYTDIAGHYGEEAINALRGYGVGFETAEYKPNTEITQGEFVTLLNSVFFRHDGIIYAEKNDFAEVCRIAVNRGILRESEVDAGSPLTRETAAVLLIRAMGLEQVAGYDIYKAPFTDVSGAHTGHIAILRAMKVFSGDGNGKFMPEKKLTRADAAIVLYNYLMNSKGET